MRSILGVGSFLLGVIVLFRNRYQILNSLLAVRVIRKLVVVTTMNMPTVRRKILPSIFGRSAS